VKFSITKQKIKREKKVSNRKPKVNPKIKPSRKKSDINKKMTSLPEKSKKSEKLNKLNFNLILIIKEYLPIMHNLTFLKVNKKLSKIIKERTDLVVKYKQFSALACENKEHCKIACGKRIYKDFCIKNFEKFFYSEKQQQTNNIKKTTKNSSITCLSCKAHNCKKCANKTLVKCSGPLTRFINKFYQRNRQGCYHPYTPTCKNRYYFKCAEKIIKCDKCLKYFCNTCTFSAVCRRCKKKICAECCFREHKYSEAKSGYITCRRCELY